MAREPVAAISSVTSNTKTKAKKDVKPGELSKAQRKKAAKKAKVGGLSGQREPAR
jgi:hypothetical protein